MSNIVIFSLSNITWTKEKYVDSFVQGMISALERNGNNVLHIRTNDFRVRNVSFVYETRLGAKIKKFNPDLIITFNNVLPYPEVLRDINCPVACFAADSCAFLANQNVMRKYADRYDFFNFSNDTIQPFYEWFPYIKKERIHLFGHVSDLRANDIEQNINVSFIGSIATWNRDFSNYFKSLYVQNIHATERLDENQIKDDFFKELDRLKDDPHSEFNCPLPDFNPHITSPNQAAILLLTSKSRIDVLSQLTDLGLTLFGYPDVYADTLIYNYDLFRCYDFSTNATMEHATYNYNRSKISLNLPHAHTREGLSWRVCDILASNAVLLSCKQPDLINITKGYVDLPMYESPAEAREITKKLLGDDQWRKDLVLGCQKMIDDKCRFEGKFKIMEDAIPDINLFPKNSKGQVEFLNEKEYLRKNRHLAFRIYKRTNTPQTPKTFRPHVSWLTKMRNKCLNFIARIL